MVVLDDVPPPEYEHWHMWRISYLANGLFPTVTIERILLIGGLKHRQNAWHSISRIEKIGRPLASQMSVIIRLLNHARYSFRERKSEVLDCEGGDTRR